MIILEEYGMGHTGDDQVAGGLCGDLFVSVDCRRGPIGFLEVSIDIGIFW